MVISNYYDWHTLLSVSSGFIPAFIDWFYELDSPEVTSMFQEEIFCTSFVTSYYLRHILGYSGKVYLLGMPGFARDLAVQGIDSIGPGEDHIQGEPSDWIHTKLDPEVKNLSVHFTHMGRIMVWTY